ncbi:MAG: cation-translocating P-type ATPase [Vulcanimicrobiota bacterium]
MKKENLKVNKPWNLSVDQLEKKLKVDTTKGLDANEVEKRRKATGKNIIRKKKKKSAWKILFEQFKSLMILLLAVAATLAFAFEQTIEGYSILVVIVINTAIGFFTEYKAARSMEALRELSRVDANVRREGNVQSVSGEELVPGDVVVLEAGNVVSADVRLIMASKLQVNESALTGESVPVDKQVDKLPEDTRLAGRKNMVFKGTAITRGTGEGIVVSTGMDTQLGEISSLAQEAEDEETPIEQRLNELAHKLIRITLTAAPVVAVAGIIAGKDTFLMVETGIALAIATVPEGLPVVATLAMARGMWKMAKRNALINRLSSVETLGATNIICADKTGTMTMNKMTVNRIEISGQSIEVDGNSDNEGSLFQAGGESVEPGKNSTLKRLIQVGVLCNNASLKNGEEENGNVLGDPLEVALLKIGEKIDLRRPEMLKEFPEEREVSFDPDVRMMSTFHKTGNGYRVAIKGAPEAVIEKARFIRAEGKDNDFTDSGKEEWKKKNREMSGQGLRVLAMAEKKTDSKDAQPYEDMVFLGLSGLYDPPRNKIKESIAQCKDAGIRVIMATGDHKLTAGKVGSELGLLETEENLEEKVIEGELLENIDNISDEDKQEVIDANIIARLTPEQKLNLIQIHQENNSIVAMTGDGVNDAPALQKADIGIAMGRRGTQVAKEAADMILKDDAFSSIVAAVEQGRIIFKNIRNFVYYLLTFHISEVITLFLASIMNIPLPLLPLQILFLNIVIDIIPSMALGVGGKNPRVMNESPRAKNEPVLTKDHWKSMAVFGIIIATMTLTAFLISRNFLGMNMSQAVTVSFLTISFSQLWHIFNLRGKHTTIIKNEITYNPYVWGAIALCISLLLTAVYYEKLAGILKVKPPGADGWMLVLGLSLVPLIYGQARIYLKREN